jgi:uncharacterized protein GlcG (DUF336 family)
VEEHCFPGLSCYFGQIRWRHDDEIIGGLGVSGWSRDAANDYNRNRHAAKTLRKPTVHVPFHTISP